MIKLKIRTLNYDKPNEKVSINFRDRKTNTLEHLCAIDTLICNILENDENIKDLDKVFELIKVFYEVRKEIEK